MPRDYWNAAVRTRAQAILEELTKEGKPHQWMFGPAMELRFRSLSALMTREWPNGQRIRWEILREAVNRCIEEQVSSLTDVERELTGRWDAMQRAKGTGKVFRVTLPVNACLEEAVPLPWVVPGAEHETRVVLDVRPRDGAEYARRFPERFQTPVRPEPVAVEVIVKASDAESASMSGLGEAARWRNAINLIASYTTARVQVTEQCRAIVDPITVAWIADADGSGTVTSANVDSGGTFCGLWQSLSRWHAETATQELSTTPWDADEGSIDRLRSEAERIFGLALDQARWPLAFLLLWQVAEHLTLPKGQRGQHEEVCKRLPMLSSQDAGGRIRTRAALEEIERMRNDMVHGGAIGCVGASDVAFLEGCCCSAIMWLGRNREHLPTVDHLWDYYRVADAKPEQVERTRWVLERLGDIAAS